MQLLLDEMIKTNTKLDETILQLQMVEAKLIQIEMNTKPEVTP